MLPMQEMMMTSQLAFDVPFGGILALTLLAVLASGVAFESGVLGTIKSWFSGGSGQMPGRVATAGQRS